MKMRELTVAYKNVTTSDTFLLADKYNILGTRLH